MTEMYKEASAPGQSDGEVTPNIDPFLSNLVFLVELIATKRPDAGLTIPVTLTAGGAMITGDITSARTWWPKFEHAFLPDSQPHSSSHEVAAGIPEMLTANLHKVWQSVYVKDSPEEFGQIAYLHLTDARVALPMLVPLPPSEGLLMRVKLEEVQTWSPGKLL